MMIIEKLFGGEIYPAETVAPRHDQEYVRLGTTVSERLTNLQKSLSEVDFAEVETLHTELMTMQMKEAEANFGYGLAIGVQLVLEVMEILGRNNKPQ